MRRTSLLVIPLFLTASTASAIGFNLLLSDPGPGLAQGHICASNSPTCSTAPAFTLVQNSPFDTGGMDYEPSSNTVVFGFTYASDGQPPLARFTGSGSGVTDLDFEFGTVRTLGTTVPVTQTPLGGGSYQLTQNGPQVLEWQSSFLVFPGNGQSQFTATNLALNGFQCTINPNGVDPCSFSLGQLGAAPIHLGPAQDPYDLFGTFQFNLMPEPSTGLLVGVGIVGMATLRRRCVGS